MEPEGSLPHSQQPATCPYPEPYPIVLLPMRYVDLYVALQRATIKTTSSVPHRGPQSFHRRLQAVRHAVIEGWKLKLVYTSIL